MNTTKESEYAKLLDYLTNHSEENNFVEKYLLSGLARNNNLGGFLTPSLFYKHFYVPKSTVKEGKANEIVKELFSDSNHNVLAIKAHGGSGKTVFINMLPERVNLGNVQYINIDFETSSDTGYKSAINKILQRTRKWLDPMFDATATQKYQLQFREYADHIIKTLDNDELYSSDLCELWKRIIDEIFIEENLNVSQRINKVIRSLSFEKIENLTAAYKLKGIQIACLLMATLIFSKPNDEDKYIIVLDNLEAISNNLTSLPQVISHTWTFLRDVLETFRVDFCKKFTYFIIVRTTTNIVLTAQQNDTFWGAGNKFIYDLSYDDFCAEALLKKLKFLYLHPNLKASKLYKDTFLLCSLICTEYVINNYLNNKEVDDIDYKLFTKEKLSPFFGNNFRLVISHLCGLVANENKHKRINSLLFPSKGEALDINTNGARGILFNSIFSSFASNAIINGETIFSYFGIDNISGEQKHSMTRILLAFLYWDKVRNCVRNNGNTEYRGVSLKRIVDTFKFHYTNEGEIEEFAKIIYRISPLSEEDTIKTTALSLWSYLITINWNGNESKDIDRFIDLVKQYFISNETNREIENIRVNLSDAGFCYITSVSNQFEFYNARIEELEPKSLFMLDNDIKEDKFVFELLIENNLTAITNYVNGMIKNGKMACQNYKKAPTQVLCYKDKKFDNYDIFNCSLFIRYLETSSTIIEAINYIDRYRLFLWLRYADKEADTKILDILKKYCELLSEIRNSCTLYRSLDKRPNKDLFSNIKIDTLLKKKGLIRLPQNAYYFLKDKNDVIFNAIEFEKLNHSGTDIYSICKNNNFTEN